jgi:hypothetical protein
MAAGMVWPARVARQGVGGHAQFLQVHLTHQAQSLEVQYRMKIDESGLDVTDALAQ